MIEDVKMTEANKCLSPEASDRLCPSSRSGNTSLGQSGNLPGDLQQGSSAEGHLQGTCCMLAPTLLPLLLGTHRACLLDRPSPNGGLLQSRSAAHHGAWTRVSRSSRTCRPAFGKAFSKGNSSDQRVGVSGVEILFILAQRWKRNTA